LTLSAAIELVAVAIREARFRPHALAAGADQLSLAAGRV
jgi:hypothetical protein